METLDLDVQHTSDGKLKLQGHVIRTFNQGEGEPDVLAIVDVIKAIKGCTYNTAKVTLQRLINNNPELGTRVYPKPSGRREPCKCATASDLVYIISHLSNCPIAQKIREAGASLFSRVSGGDQRLHAVVDAARAEQERLAVDDPENIARAFGQQTEAEGGSEPPPPVAGVPAWAVEWRGERTGQKESGKSLKETIFERCSDKVRTIQEVENYMNQGVLCFEGATHAFKTQNGVPKDQPMADWMNTSQVNLRRLMQDKFHKTVKEHDGELTPNRVKSMARQERDFMQMVSKYYGQNEFDAEHYEGRVKKLEKRCLSLEKAQERTNKRLKTLERRKEASVTERNNESRNTIVALFANMRQGS